jgi:hypothetical protein
MGHTREYRFHPWCISPPDQLCRPDQVIQIRCEEVDWRASWKWALPVFDLEVDAARRAQSGSSRRRGVESDAVMDVRDRKEQYLRRLLVSVGIMQVC